MLSSAVIVRRGRPRGGRRGVCLAQARIGLPVRLAGALPRPGHRASRGPVAGGPALRSARRPPSRRRPPRPDGPRRPGRRWPWARAAKPAAWAGQSPAISRGHAVSGCRARPAASRPAPVWATFCSSAAGLGLRSSACCPTAVLPWSRGYPQEALHLPAARPRRGNRRRGRRARRDVHRHQEPQATRNKSLPLSRYPECHGHPGE